MQRFASGRSRVHTLRASRQLPPSLVKFTSWKQFSTAEISPAGLLAAVGLSILRVICEGKIAPKKTSLRPATTACSEQVLTAVSDLWSGWQVQGILLHLTSSSAGLQFSYKRSSIINCVLTLCARKVSQRGDAWCGQRLRRISPASLDPTASGESEG